MNTVVIEEQKKRSFIDRLTRREVRKDEAGLALLDVLIGMALFALIALIALQALGQYRQKAFMTGTTSDARSLGTAIEAEMINKQSYPAHVAVTSEAFAASYTGVTGTTNLGKVSKGNTLGWFGTKTVDGVQGFAFCIQHSSNGSADAASVYDSLTGGVTKTSDKFGCTGTGMTAANNGATVTTAPTAPTTP